MSMFVTFLNAEQAVSIFFFLIYLAFHVLRLKGREKIEIDQRLEHEFFTKILNTYVAIYGWTMQNVPLIKKYFRQIAAFLKISQCFS